ncbi:hypothetical protein EDB86DRAFT_2155380 [Lactarius hatsudake]|nr:hypothetical protein EDB86DRAFT_2155380 [Lactarius hatsudake]
MDILPRPFISRADPSTTTPAALSSSSAPPSVNISLASPDAAIKRHSSSSRTGGRSYTDANPSSLEVRKRIIVCCDGTWQDGLVINERWKYTNILRLSRALHHVDKRFVPPIPQIVFYQAGVGTEPNLIQSLLDGATGASLGDKVQEAYGFIAHNYEPGDEIFLFGFSRGAYTARMVADMIGKIGVLDRTDMDHFADIFVDFQARGKTKDKDRIELLDAKLAPWTQHTSPGKMRADCDGDSFSVKCVGVFDTVGSLGLPEELAFGSKRIKTLFGFPDSVLGDHVERAYQALALNETRADFNCNKFQLSEEGRGKKQVLKQCWFAGSHSDIGGGYKEHDLSDITLFWMLANVEDIVAIDTKYLFSLLQPSAPWGTQKPHDPQTGFFVLANSIQRQIPTSFNPGTHESIHPSILEQSAVLPQLKNTLATYPDLISQLMPLEQQAKQQWPPPSGQHMKEDTTNTTEPQAPGVTIVVARGSIISRAMKSLRRPRRDSATRSIRTLSQGRDLTGQMTLDEKGWLARMVQETSFGVFIRDLV